MRRLLLALLLVSLTWLPAEAGVTFNSTTDRLSASTFTLPTTGSVCTVVKPSWAQTDNAQHIFLWIATTSANDNFVIEKTAGNSLNAGWTTATVSYRVDVASGNYTLNQSQYNRICLTYDDTANESKLYLNGKQIGTTTATLATWNTAAESWVVGNAAAANGNINCSCDMAETAVWSRVLLSSELDNSLNGLLASNIPSNLSNYWSLPNVSTLTDGAGSENLTNANATDSGDHPTTLTLPTDGGIAPFPTVILGTPGTDTLSEADATSATTAAFAITANKLYTIQVLGRVSSGTPNTPTITCHSMTWVLIDSQADALDQLRKVFLFRGLKTSGSASATCSIDFGGQTQLRIGWAVIEWANVDTSGTNGSGAIVQSAKNAATASASLTVTFGSAFSSSNNRAYSTWYMPESGGLFDAEAGWLDMYQQAGTENQAMMGMWRDDTGDTTPNVSINAGTELVGIAIEIKAATGGGGGGSRQRILGTGTHGIIQ